MERPKSISWTKKAKLLIAYPKKIKLIKSNESLLKLKATEQLEGARIAGSSTWMFESKLLLIAEVAMTFAIADKGSRIPGC